MKRFDAPEGVGATALRGDEPITDELCLFVVSLSLDRRPVPAELFRRVEQHLAGNRELSERVEAMRRDAELLRNPPGVRVPDGFAERVLAERRARAAARPTRGRGLLAAAVVLLALGLAWDLGNPSATRASDDTASRRFRVDELQPDPFGVSRIEAALRTWLPGPLDGESAAPATDQAVESGEGSEPDDPTGGDR